MLFPAFLQRLLQKNRQPEMNPILYPRLSVSDDSALMESLSKIGDNVWKHDFTSSTTIFSANLEQLLGYDLSQYPDKESFWWNIIHPHDKHLLEINDYGYKSGLLSNHSMEYRVRHHDGSFRWIHDRGVVTSKTTGGKPLFIVGTHADITARKMYEIEMAENERRFRDLAKNVPGVVYQWKEDSAGVSAFTYISPRLKEYFGIEPEDMHLLIKWIHPDDQAKWQASVDLARSTGLPWKFEGRLLYPGGMIKWFRGQSIRSKKDEHGMVYNGFMTDITEEMEHKQRTLKAVINAQENERQSISYELHDNVNQVLATTKLLIDLIKPADERMNSYVKQSSENLDTVMQEIRNISHGLATSMLGFVGLKGAIRDLLVKVNETKTVRITAHISEELEQICMDKEIELSVFRIIQSQISNILRHSKATEALIDISTGNSDVSIVISDNGVGFHPMEGSRGLGLINIKNRAELFNGTAALLSSPGNGCKLVVCIPLL